jgi:hypothetical protein
VGSGIAFGILAFAVVAGTIALFRSRSAKSSRTIAVPDELPTAVWKGGLRTQTVNATSGTARLEMFDWGVRVRGRGFWQVLLPTWEARYSELATAQLIEWPIANHGVLMRTDSSVAPLVFVTLRDREVLEALAARGVLVDRSVSRLRLTDLVQAR